MDSARILVIDDSEVFLELAGSVLRKAGYDVSVLKDGRSALAEAQQSEKPLALVIVDIIMPEMDGLEVITAFRRFHPGVRIIAVSGGGEIGPGQYLRVAESLGVDSTLTKPFGAEDILAVVRKVLDRK